MSEPVATAAPEAGPDLYLELLKRVLTDTLFGNEPDIDNPNFIRAFREHYIRGRALTMAPVARLDNVRDCLVDVIRQGVPGDAIETGVWRGGMTIFMRGIMAALGVQDRNVWVADSFEGLPTPDAGRFPLEAQAHASATMRNDFRHFSASLEEVKAGFATFNLLDDQVRFLPGWFSDTLPSAPINQIALLRLDGDYYESTSVALRSLYDKLSVGGYVIIDDYGEDRWTYCRRAVDEFRKERNILDELRRVDSKCYFWRRGR